ncbi:DNA topoisomerase I, mitochondrial [Anopheles bellator]|uniref:DNA topoisomerase I, mitochondrial n=1 Tax=Anopheles bellator TaxID=139047 RepID=UPI0026495AF2|nr:DNA topoisomerase I, mitochondrial [Anopheles bellator]
MSVETVIPPASGHPQPADSLKQMNGIVDRPNGVSNGHAVSGGSGGGGENGNRHKSHKSSSKDKHRDKDRDHHRSDKDKHRDKDRHREKDREREKDKHRDRERDKQKSSSGSGGHSSKSGGSSSKDKDKEKHGSSGSSSTNKDKERSHHTSSSSHKSSKSDKDRSKDKERDKDKHRSREDGKDRSERDKKDRDKSSRSDKDKHKSSSSTSSSKDKDRDKHKSSGGGSSSRDKDKHSSSGSSKRDKDKHSSSSSSSRHRREGKDDEGVVPAAVAAVKPMPIDDADGLPREFLNGDGHVKVEHDMSQECRGTKPHDALDMSQASSCDYSLSQFRADETPFPLKNESMDHNQSNQREDYREGDDEGDEDGDEEGGDSGGDNDDEEYGNENGHDEQPQQQQQLHYQQQQHQQAYYGGMQDQYQQHHQQLQIKQEPRDEFKREPQSEESEDDIPLSKRKKKDADDGYEEGKKKKIKVEKKDKKKLKKRSCDSDEDGDDDDYGKKKSKKAKIKKESLAKQDVQKTKLVVKTEVKTEPSPTKGGRKKKEEEEQEVWKWWEEEKREDGGKWTFLEHKGPVFAPPYDPLPENVKFEYDGREMKLSVNAEEVAGFYARMLDHDYTSKAAFNDNFFKDWRRTMTESERARITDLSKCNFRSMAAYFAQLAEQNRNRTKEQKVALKEENEKLMKEYGVCMIDGHKEKIGNFKIEPPGLFRGRGEHPKMGLVKRRVMPEDVTINCSEDSKIPVAPAGHRWKEVRHDNAVSWLASWTENVQGQVKYIMLNPSSKLKGEKDWQKYETARQLLKHIDRIRATYHEEWKSKEMRIRQRAVAMYFIDKLALRAGNEKDDDQADTVGCCSLRVEHIELCKERYGKENVVVFDFLGKDSIRYYNEVEVEKRVFKNLELFKENKRTGDDLFDRLTTTLLNEYLKSLMIGLTAKVFRTFNASFTLQKQLEQLTDPKSSVPEKLLSYNRANRAVAILCNHQRAVPKTHEKSMGNLKEKIRVKREQVEQCQKELKDLKKSNVRDAGAMDKKTKQLERLNEQLKKLELQETDRDENKTIALGTSKLNYLDPRISVAWCKKFGVPIEKIFNKTQRDKFRWAIDMADETYVF